MKKTFFLIILIILTAAVKSQIAPQFDFVDKLAKAESKNAEIIFNKAPLAFNGDQFDLKFHRFQLTVDPAVCFISGSVTSYFEVVKSSVSQISFDLNDSLITDSVKFHSTLLTFSQPGNQTLLINFPTPLAFGQLDSVTVYYHGIPPSGAGFGSFIQSTHNGTPIIWTLSEPFGAKEWWPCKNDLSDKIDSVEMIVTTPQQYRVASNGMLLSETLNGAEKTYRWKHRYPIAAYLIAIAVTDYAVYSDYASVNGNNIEVLNYVFPENLVDAQNNSPNLLPVFNIYDSLFMPYPYINERYGHAQFGWGGGMEHQTMTFLVNFGFELMAHEFAHQWVGDMITCSNWHDIWLNEGFATYWTGLTYENLFNQYYWKIWKSYQIQNITSDPGGSVYCSDTSNVWRIFDGRLSYAKGAMILHSLRWIIGDSAFFSGIKNYLSDPLLKYNYACSDDFISHMETASGQSLTWYFNDWLYGEGYPIYNIQCNMQPNFDIDVIIAQTQSHSSVSFFELPVPLRFKDGTHDTVVVFNNSIQGQQFTVNLGFYPDSVLFDPDLWLIAKLDTVVLNVHEIADMQSSFSVFPNPVQDIITIETNGISSGTIEILDITGRITASFPIGNDSKKEIDLTSYKNGVYLIGLRGQDFQEVQRIIKM